MRVAKNGWSQLISVLFPVLSYLHPLYDHIHVSMYNEIIKYSRMLQGVKQPQAGYHASTPSTTMKVAWQQH